MSDDIGFSSLYKMYEEATERAAKAEARVKELEANADELTARLAGVGEKGSARITQLEADLAAARTINAHALVQEVVEKVRVWVRASEKDHNGKDRDALFDAIHAARDITIQPVRTYTPDEAEAMRDRWDDAWAEWGEMKVGDPRLHDALQKTRNVGDEIRNALMGVPVPGDAERLKRMESALRDFSEHGTRHDLTPSVVGGSETVAYLRQMQSMDAHVMRVARAALGCPCDEPGDTECVVHDAPQGHDEAGGEGAASAYDEVMERVNTHQVANAPQEDAGFLIDDAALGAEGDSLVTLIRAVRLINAKVDTLARKA